MGCASSSEKKGEQGTKDSAKPPADDAAQGAPPPAPKQSTPEKVPEPQETIVPKAEEENNPAGGDEASEKPIQPQHPHWQGPATNCRRDGKKACAMIWAVDNPMGYYNGEFNCDRCGRTAQTGDHWHCPVHYCDFCPLCEPKEIDGA